ncbi:MAG: hypothetical protein ACK56I_11950, partial [bacterium]
RSTVELTVNTLHATNSIIHCHVYPMQAALYELLLHHAVDNFQRLGMAEREKWQFAHDSDELGCFNFKIARILAYDACWWTKMDRMGQPVGGRNHNAYVYFWDSRAHPGLRGFNLINPVSPSIQIQLLS